MTNDTGQLEGKEDGAAAIIVAIMAFALLGMAVFAVDFGLAYSRLRQLQIASDAGALAAAKELADAAGPGVSCAQVLQNRQTQADVIARNYAQQNAPAGSALASGTAPTGWSGDAGVAFRCNAARNAEVQVRTVNNSPSIFGALWGKSNYPLSRPATAAMGPGTAFTGLRPFSLCSKLAEELIKQEKATPGVAQLVTIDKVWNPKNPSGLPTMACPGADKAGGNWGVLGLDGSSNDPKETTLWTDVGYNQQLDLSKGFLTFPGNPGFPAPNAGQCTVANGCQQQVKTEGALNDILGQPSLLPVWEAQTGKGGNNADFRVVGVLAVRLCGWQLGNSSGTIPDSSFGGTPCYDSTTPGVQLPSGKADAFQVRLDRYIPIGELSSGCGLDSLTFCVNNPRVTQLIN